MNIYKAVSEPIPELASVAGWKELPLSPNDEPLVPLGLLSKYRVFTSSIYYGEHENSPYSIGQLDGSLITVFVRQAVAEQLLKAEQSLPLGYHLIVFDAYRPLEVQQSLYGEYYRGLKLKQLSWSEEKLVQETQKYVSLPSNNPSRPSPHNTGGSVDLAFIRLPDDLSKRLRDTAAENSEESAVELARAVLANATMPEFGTAFDFGGPEAALRHIEDLAALGNLDDLQMEALKNRRILYHLMDEVGMEAYPDEWWHYNSPKSQMGAKTAGLAEAKYGAVTLSLEDREYESRRRALAEKIPRSTNLPMAAIIRPQQD